MEQRFWLSQNEKPASSIRLTVKDDDIIDDLVGIALNELFKAKDVPKDSVAVMFQGEKVESDEQLSKYITATSRTEPLQLVWKGKTLRDASKLTYVRLVKSSNSYNSYHAAASIKISTLRSIASSADISKVLNFQTENFSISNEYASEDDVKFYVRMILHEIFKALNEENRIFISNEVCVSELRPDLWLLLRNDLYKTPIGFVEIKNMAQPHKPPRLNSAKVLGQMYDYLKMFKSFFKLDFVLALITTFNEWRACWLPIDSTTLAAAAYVHNEELEEFNPDDLCIPDMSDLDTGENDGTDDDKLPVSTADRMVCGTEIFELNESGDCLAMVTNVIRTMCKSKPIPSRLIASDQEYVVYGKDNWYWSLSPWKDSDYPVFGQMPTKQCTNFYILKPLGSGESGRVWLACCQNRKMCALKFCKDNNLDCAQKESLIWQRIGFKKSRVVTFMKYKHAIVMPYLLTCSRLKMQHNLYNLVQNAIKEFSSYGLCHDDISLANIGYYRQGKTIKVSLMDFSAVSEKESTVAENNMLGQLRELTSDIQCLSAVDETKFLSAFNTLSLS